MTRRQRKPVVQIAEVRRAKYLNVKAIAGADYAITDGLYRAPFPQNSAELRAAADRALVAELEAAARAVELEKKK